MAYHHTQVQTVLRLADIAQAMDLSTDDIDPIGTLVTRGTPVGPDVAPMLYAAALRAATERLDGTTGMVAHDLNDLVIDEMDRRDAACTCAEEAALVRDLCGEHNQ